MGWMRWRSRPVWKQALHTAACFLLICAVAFGVVMAVSPTARAAVLQWFRVTFTQHAAFYQGLDAAPAKPTRQSELKDETGKVIGTVTEVGNLVITDYSDIPEEYLDSDYNPINVPESTGTPEAPENPDTSEGSGSGSPMPGVTIEEDGTIYIDADQLPKNTETFEVPPKYAPT